MNTFEFVARLPAYTPEERVRGRIVAWGDPAFDSLIARWMSLP